MDEDKETREQAEEDAKEDLELKDEEADKVGGGGKATFNEFTITKATDKASP